MPDWFDKQTIGDLLNQAAERFGPREALMYEGRRWTFAEFRDEVDRVARALINLGVQPGDKVSLWMPNRAEWLFLFGAIAKIGAVIVPINTRFRTGDMEYLVQHSDSTALILMDRSGPVDYLDMLREVAPEVDSGDAAILRPQTFPALRNVIVLGDDRPTGVIGWDAMLAGADEVPAQELVQREASVSPDDTFLLMYTSGTTGFPKGVMHCHNPIRTITDAANRMGMSSRDVILMYLPLFHCFGLYEGPLMSWVTGARVVLTTMFDAGEVLQLLESERATVMDGFDTHFFDLTHHPDVDRIDKSSLRTILLAVGMASSEPTARLTQEKLCPSLSAWGMTEVGVGATRTFLDAPEDDRCVESGHALPGYEFKVIDPETGDTLPPSTIGELCVRGYAMMQGYYKRPEATAEAIDDDGWFHTGDVATMRDDGSIRFMGRYKDMLKVGGENVDPTEVEAFLLEHPAVNKVQVIGVPDPRLTEVACACVVVEPGQAITDADLDSFCRGKMASFKIPRHLVVLDDYPMTSSGKVQKYLLRQMAAEQLGLAG
ncbi:MAG: AMP-binding protein [Dehalococcoidia bacterium]|nr:AMP-binding protein [Dehalococcoidia bacterium]